MPQAGSIHRLLDNLDLLLSQSVQFIHDLVDELVRLLDLRVKLLGALLRLQIVLQVVGHVVDGRQLDRLQPIDE